jgi:hypothetical protein
MNQAVVDEFWRYVHRRMCVRAAMYKDTCRTMRRGERAPRTVRAPGRSNSLAP